MIHVCLWLLCVMQSLYANRDLRHPRTHMGSDLDPRMVFDVRTQKVLVQCLTQEDKIAGTSESGPCMHTGMKTK